MLTILEGSTFCICDELGDIAAETTGFFTADTRFLSRFALRVEGAVPLLLSSGRTEHFAAAFFLRNDPGGRLAQDAVSISRERFVGSGLQERIALRNESMDRIELRLELDIAADFADIISVKNHDFAFGDPERADPLPPPAAATLSVDARELTIEDPRGDLRTRARLSRAARFENGTVVFDLALEGHERWDLTVDVRPVVDGAPATGTAGRPDAERIAPPWPQTRSPALRHPEALPEKPMSEYACHAAPRGHDPYGRFSAVRNSIQQAVLDIPTFLGRKVN